MTDRTWAARGFGHRRDGRFESPAPPVRSYLNGDSVPPGSAPVRWRVEAVSRAGSRPSACFLGKGRRLLSGEESSTGGDHRFGPLMHGSDDFGVVDPAQVSLGDRKVGMPELALDDDQRDALAGHLHSVRVAQLAATRTADPHPPQARSRAAVCGSRPTRTADRVSDRA
jgi:hypothetical protein